MLRDEVTEAEKNRMSEGVMVGELARRLFPGGVLCSESVFDFSKNLQKTKKMVDMKMPVLYEAAFEARGVYVAVDILLHREGKWELFEVKSSTKLKGENIIDVRLQDAVLAENGIDLSTMCIINIDSSYERNGPLDINQLFKQGHFVKREDYENIWTDVERYKEILCSDTVPQVEMGRQCKYPYQCKFMPQCKSELNIPSSRSILDLKRGGDKIWHLLNDRGIKSTVDIPNDVGLTGIQTLQVLCDRGEGVRYNVPGIESFIGRLKYPLTYLDFESVATAVPMIDHTKPYEQICFQYSLHYQELPFAGNSEVLLEHDEFLADDFDWFRTDPQLVFLESLIADINKYGDEGTILVYNKSFEAGRLKALAEKYTQHYEEVKSIIWRFRDVAQPFQEMVIYKSSMQGSYSLKKVVPAMIPELADAYNDLNIGNGAQANLAFLQLLRQQENANANLADDEEFMSRRSQIRHDLLEYCKLDTYVMVKLIEEMHAICSKK